MEKREIIGFVLIGVILMIWMMWSAPTQQQQQAQQRTADSIAIANQHSTAQTPAAAVAQGQKIASPVPSDSQSMGTYGKYFSPFATGTEKSFHVETDLFSAEFTSKGGMLKKWELKKFYTWDKSNLVQLVNDLNHGDLSMLFTSTDGKIISTADLYFANNAPVTTVTLAKSDGFTLEYSLPITETSKLIRRYIFKNGEYGFKTEQQFVEMQNIISGDEFQLVWEHGLRFTEYNSVDEAGFAKATAYSGGELKEVDATKAGEQPTSNFSGTTEWVATHTKYFGIALLPMEGKSSGAYLEGEHFTLENHGMREQYKIALKVPFKGTRDEKSAVTVFFGPLDRKVLQTYNAELDKMLSLGWTWLVRPISEYFILPLFYGLHSFISNYGIVLILFSFIIKLLLHPLTKKSMDSMKRMQKLQPMLAEIKEKHKDDPTKVNQATMKLYSEYGINPAGGCLPVVLQMPILFALFAVFRSTIDLRQAPFVGWIHDLSMPDTLFTLPFSIPFFNITHISGLALILGITQFLQSRQTNTDPRQKAMIYMMPLLMFFLFNSFPSGLNLYYTLFNVLSIGQQWYINKTHENEPLQKVDPKLRKPSFMEKMAKQAEETRKAQKRK